jgi:type III secretion system-like peptide-binding chaperone
MPDSEAVSTLRTTLGGYLQEIARAHQTDADGDFVLVHDQGVMWLRPLDWVEGRTIVRVWSITNVGLRADSELARFILTENAKLIFGGFSLDPERPAVAFGHTLLGDVLQRKELEVAIGAVASTTGHYAEQIKARFGGRLFTEGP